MISHPGGTLTLLFTDLVDSTAVANRLGDEAAQALRRAHDRILHQQFEAHDGTVIKGTGDGFFATFLSARQGVECAVAIQRAIATQQAEGRYRELSVRIGVNTGEPVVEGEDLFGTDVTLAARIMADAQGGEVLISEVTNLLVRQHDFELEPAGERTLKGFPHPVPVHRVLWSREASHQRRLSRFVGRLDEQARLRAHVDSVLQGSGSLVFIAGEPGIGKTRLATELATFAQDRGARILSGRAFETEGLPPYFPVADALTKYLRTRSQQDIGRLIGQQAPHLYRVLPDLRPSTPAEDRAPLSSDSDRYLLFEAILDLFVRLAEEAPVILLLDDLHWADHATIHLLAHIARSIAKLPVLIVATYREVELGDVHPLHNLATEIARRGPGECVVLQPLSKDDSTSLVEDVLGHQPDAEVADELYSTAEGNPFFTEELIGSLREQSTSQAVMRLAPGTAVPEGVRQIVLQRLSLLSDEMGSLLPYCAVIGHNLTLARLVAVTGHTEEELVNFVEQALDARVFRETGDGFAFGHPLIRETINQSMAVVRRQQLHRDVGNALEALYEREGQPNIPELAHHFLEAATDDASTTKALDYATRAAAEALDVFAYEDALAFHERAIALLDRAQSKDPVARSELLLALADAQAKSGEGTLAEQTIREAVDIAERHQLAAPLALAAIRYHDVRGSSGIVDDFFIHTVDEACRRLPESDSTLRARLLAVRPTAYYHVEPHERLAELTQEAIAMAKRIGDPTTLVWVLGATHAYRHHLDDLTGQLESAAELLELAQQYGPRETALRARRFRLDVLLRLGDIVAFDHELDALERGSQDLRQPVYTWRVAVSRAMRVLLAGRLEEAERLARHAYEIGKEVPGDSGLAFQFLAIQLFAIRREQGQLTELRPVVQSFIDQYPALRWRVGLAYVLYDGGDLEEARREFEGLAESDFAELPKDFNWLISATILAEVCAWLGSAEHAPALYDLLSPHANYTAVIGDTVACNGSVSRYLGLLATTMERWNDAESHFDAALHMNERMGARPFVAHTRQEFAAMLLRRGWAQDTQRARTLLELALTEAQVLGLKRVEERAGMLLNNQLQNET